MLQLDAIQGSQVDYVLGVINRDGSQPTQFLSSDTLTATVSQGQNQPALFNPTVTWNSYLTGLVNVQIAGSQTSGLDQVAACEIGILCHAGYSDGDCIKTAMRAQLGKLSANYRKPSRHDRSLKSRLALFAAPA